VDAVGTTNQAGNRQVRIAMAKVRFKKTLLRIVKPTLELLGYEFVEIPGWSPGVFLFRKRLWDNVYAFVNFWVHPISYPPSFSFTVDLIRNQGDEPKPACVDHEICLDLRLGHVLKSYYKLDFYPYGDHWWEYSSRDELDTQIRDALEKLVTYGLPWLEDPASRRPGLPDHATIGEFFASLGAVVAPVLQPHGYEFVETRLIGGAWGYFRKRLCAKTHSFVLFTVASQEDDAGRLGTFFGVSLARNPGPMPTFEHSGRMFIESNKPLPERWLQRLVEKGTNQFFVRTDKPWPEEFVQRLAEEGARVVFFAKGEEFPRPSREELHVFTSLQWILEKAGYEIPRQPGYPPILTWHVHDREELRAALLEASRLVIEYGLPWIENLDNVT